MTDPTDSSETELRERAVRLLKKRSDFRVHLLVYVLVNGTLVTMWAIAGAGFFWPVFPILGWGIGLVLNAWDVFRPDPISEERVRAQMDRLRR